MRISFQAYLTPSYSRNVLKGFLAYRQTRRNWTMMINSLWKGMDPDLVPQLDAICIVGSTGQEDFISPHITNRVYIGGHVKKTPYVRVESDSKAIGIMAAEYFAKLNIKQVTWVNRSNENFLNQRCLHFARHAEKLNLKVLDPFLMVRHWQNGLEQKAVAKWLADLPKPIGIFAFNDFHALEISNLCQTLGVEIPREVALLGVDNDIIHCESCPVPVSSIDHGTFRMGWEAASAIDRIAKGGKRIENEVIVIPPVGVVERASTNVLAVDDPALKSAILFIRKNACNGINIDQVVQHAGLNRRTLERRFSQLVGRTIHNEIQNSRLDAAKDMLAKTKLSIAEIADRCGFSCGAELSHVFKRYSGSTPSQYRKLHVPQLYR